MGKAARAIIVEGSKILLMHRNKYGSQYFTLVGGRVNDNETIEQALVREVKEETGLDVVKGRLVFIEEHPAPYNEQYIFLCEVAPHAAIAIQETSEENYMNRFDMNVHIPLWAEVRGFSGLPFRTPQLHDAIIKSLKSGFPDEPVRL
jgi:ADP-ribose pyrophosphatase YjhB (NUDIX family)